MVEQLTRSGERGEVTDVDLEWEYLVSVAAVDTITPWHTVRFTEPKPLKCWADDYYPSGTMHGCFEIGTTSAGLCDKHHEEMIGNGP